jgi:hypothetical protein
MGIRSITITAMVALSLGAMSATAGAQSETKLVDSNGAAGDWFGGGGYETSDPGVAGDGHVIVVGALRHDIGGNVNEGSATVFRWNGASWVEEAELTSSDGAALDNFGASVSVSGDVIVVSATLDDVGLFGDEGSATVFRWNGASWVEEVKLTSSSGVIGDYFGSSVSMSGDVIVVGSAFKGFVGSPQQGSATVFRWNGANWVEEAQLTSSTGAANDFFGVSVSVSGDVIVVGANKNDIGGNDYEGSATVFRWNGVSWVEEVELTSSDGAANDGFGISVAVSGDVIVAGALGDDIGGNAFEGSATVFRWNGANWVEEVKLTSSNGAAGDLFGHSVSMSGDVIVVGAIRSGSGGSGHGSATVFRWNGTNWVEEVELTSSDGAGGDEFGSSVWVGGDVTGETVVVGAPHADIGGNADQGAAYVYDITPNAWTDEGCALAGVSGEPALAGTGTLADGSSNSVDLTNAAPSATAGLFLALGPITPAAFKGGTLKPIPFLIDPVILNTSPAGEIPIPFVMPSGIPPGTELWIQWAIQDAAAVKGVALSNAILGVTP